jgi:hypothetical protein
MQVTNIDTENLRVTFSEFALHRKLVPIGRFRLSSAEKQYGTCKLLRFFDGLHHAYAQANIHRLFFRIKFGSCDYNCSIIILLFKI